MTVISLALMGKWHMLLPMFCRGTGLKESSRGAKILLSLLLAVCFFQFLRSVDFSDYYRRTAEALAGGFSKPPYPVEKGTWGDFFQSPIVVLLLVPLSTLPLLVAKFLWASANTAGLLYVASRTVERGLSFRHALFFALLFAHALSDVFLSGNINMPLLLFCVAGWNLIHRKKTIAQVAGGLCFGLAILIKVQPALFIAWFLLNREWRRALWVVAGMSAWVAFSWLALPAGRFMPWWGGWTHALGLYPFAAGPGLVSYQSPPAVLYRLLVNQLHWNSGVAFSWASGFAAALQGGLLLFAWTLVLRGADRDRTAFPLLCAAFFLGGPFSWGLTALFLFPLVYRATEETIPWTAWSLAVFYAAIPKALWPAELWQRMAEASLPGLCLAAVALLSVSRLIPGRVEEGDV